jgi:hypothetical protein
MNIQGSKEPWIDTSNPRRVISQRGFFYAFKKLSNFETYVVEILSN